MSENINEGIKLYRNKQYTEALTFFLALPSDSVSDSIELAYYIGLSYARLNKYDEALLYLEQVVTDGKNPARVKQCRLSLAVIYSLSNRTKMAEFELSKLVEEGEESEQIECTKAYLAWYKKNIDESIACYEKALEINPESPTALNGLGYVLACSEKDLTKALFLCKKAVDSDSDSAAYLDSLGWVYYKLGLLKESKTFLKRAKEKAPNLVEIQNHYKEVVSSSSDKGK